MYTLIGISAAILAVGLVTERIRPHRYTESDRLADKQAARERIRGTR